MKTRAFILAFFSLILLAAATGFGSDEEPLIPAEAHQKAIRALKKLGPDRGGLLISSRMVRIIGVVSEISLDTAEVKQNLRDLDADITDSEIRIALSGDVLFDFDSWDIRRDAEAELKKVITIMEASKSTEIMIGGHTDSKGSEAYNRDLSLKRARAVKNWIITNSPLSETVFKLTGYGETRPVAPNENADGSDNPQGRRKNRRVEFHIKTTQK